MLDLVLAPVAQVDQVGDEGRLVDLVAGADPDRRLLTRPGPEALDECTPGGHHDPRAPVGVGGVRQAVKHPQAAPHGLDTRADPFERKRLPGREEFDVGVAEVGAEVGGQSLGLRAGGDRHDERRPTGPAGQRRQHHGPRRLGDRQCGLPAALDPVEGGFGVEQPREGLEDHRCAPVTSGR